uniref:Uncharacterized protein n=1 Tax=Arundo donax TaxID=35708 RepID=A0A0A9B0W7_ARUDO
MHPVNIYLSTFSQYFSSMPNKTY